MTGTVHGVWLWGLRTSVPALCSLELNLRLLGLLVLSLLFDVFSSTGIARETVRDLAPLLDFGLFVATSTLR